jgi:hypothetical protein
MLTRSNGARSLLLSLSIDARSLLRALPMGRSLLLAARSLLLLAGVLGLSQPSWAQSIAVTPSMPSVAAGGTIQFSAQVTGLPNPGVTWSIGGGKLRGAKAGTISSTGLYSAPTAPPLKNPVSIVATSVVNGHVAGSTLVHILAAGPVITSVSPNPLPVGPFTVSIQGSGFRSGAAVFASSGGDSPPTQLVTASLTSTLISATGVQPSAPSAAFCVQNPNSACGNSIIVPVAGAGGGQFALSVVNGAGSGSYAAGTAVAITANAPPPGQAFAQWTGASVKAPTSPSTTLVMPAANVTVTATYFTPSAIPFPVTGHPRLWIAANDLPRLRSWATPGNLVYSQGIVPVLTSAVSIYNTQFFPGGAPNPVYPDPGDVQGYTGYLTEQYGLVFAFNSLIDPDPSARIQYATYARNLLMYAMNEAALGHQAGAPFRDPAFAIYNRANGQGEQWPLIVDWIYSATDAQGHLILTAADKATIRTVFMQWADDCLRASTTGGDHPEPIGVTNSAALLPNNQPYRMAANNYYIGHARLLTMMALSIDPSDDPPLAASAPASQLGNTLRSYIANATGAWLYQQFAMFGDASAVAGAYQLPGGGAGFGLASGGLPSEGMLYGESLGFLLGQLLALQTAGFNNATYSGPQAALIGAPVWDRYVAGMLTSLTPIARTFSSEPWLGPVYQYGSYGDLLRLWVTPDYMRSFALLALLDEQLGVSTHVNSARWFTVNAVQGGPSALVSRITSPWSFTESILYYMLLDPAAPAAGDPRPALPTVFYDPAAGRVVAHSDWSAQNTLFDYRASWISINHQLGDGGQFELFRKGEWLTKEMSNYDNNALGMTTVYHNTLAMQNWCAHGTPANLQWYESGEWANGSQWMEGLDAGDPTTVMSAGPGYVYAASNLTNLYNRPDVWSPPDAATDIALATRSILWLDGDYIVVYDRATSVHPGLFKRFNLSLVVNPVIQGNAATATMTSGQQLFIQTLLPLAPSASAVYAAGNLNPIAELEPTQYIYTVEDPAKPADVRFLHVLEGADAGAPMALATYLRSTGGTAFDGAAFGNAAVYFPVDAGGSFQGTTLLAPTGTHTVFVTGLQPATGYTVSMAPHAGGSALQITAGGPTTTDAAGVLSLSF